MWLTKRNIATLPRIELRNEFDRFFNNLFGPEPQIRL